MYKRQVHELRHKFEPLLWDEPLPGQQIEQCWFAGAHADVGGGYPQGPELPNMALRWMADHATAVSAATSTPLAFAVLPAPAPDAALCPHHEIQGDFFWATPSPRAALLGFATLAPGVAATISVHPRTIARLFDAASTGYDDYPYDKEYRWTERLPGGTTYPKTVAAALTWLDDRIIELRLNGVLAEDARSGGSKPAALGPGVAAGAGQPAWRTVRSVAELRLAQDTVEGLMGRLRRVHVPMDALRHAFGVLAAFDHFAPIEQLVARAAARAARLERVALKYPHLELRIRDRWVERFANLCGASDWRGGAAPAQALPRMRPLHTALCQASESLRSKLSYRAPPPITFKKRSAPIPPLD